MNREQLDSVLRQDSMYLMNGCIYHRNYKKPIAFFGLFNTDIDVPVKERPIDWVGHFAPTLPSNIITHIRTLALVNNIKVYL